MKSSITQTVAVLVLTMGLSSAAYAAHPCKAEHQTANSACASDKHSPDCKAAHKALKSCRIAHGLPVHGTKSAGGAPATSHNNTPADNAPAAPPSR